MNNIVIEKSEWLGLEYTRKLDALIAYTLQINEEEITDDLEYRSISEWDSLGHVSLMLALEKEYDIKIDIDKRTKLVSIAAIRSYIQQLSLRTNERSDNSKRASEVSSSIPETMSVSKEKTNLENMEPDRSPTVHRGLAGVVFDRTRTTHINGRTGKLCYRGYSIHDLVMYSTFEEVAYLLLYGKLPAQDELSAFGKKLNASRYIPESIITIIRELKHARPIEVIRTAISALAAIDQERDDNSKHAFQERAIRLIAQLPTIIAVHHAIRCGKKVTQPNPALSHATNLLYMLNGEIPTEKESEILDKIFILHADHGSNASAFTARVVASTRSDLYAALTSAISAFAGELHGGAVEKVMAMFNEIGEPSHVPDYISNLLQKNKPIMGFGHRVYQTEDPRARHLRKMAQELSMQTGETKLWDIAQSVDNEMRPYAEKGIDVNVDFYASIIYHILGIPQDMFVSAFVCARMPGWISQVREQMDNNILIRPLLQYVGEVDLRYSDKEV